MAAVVFVVQAPALSARAISFDDKQYLNDNYLVRNPSWGSAGRFLREVFQPSTVDGYYQPLTMISLMMDCAVGGRPDDLRAFHRTSLALHVANTLLVILLLYALLGKPWTAAMAGLLFGVHPMTVESIAWVGERKTVLAAFFALWAFLSYVRYAQTKRRAWYGVALVTFVLALMSKPTSTPLPVLLLLLDYWPLRRLSWRAVLEKMPFFVVAALFAVITYVSQSRTGGAAVPGEYPLARMPLTLCHNIVFYLYKIVWPLRLSSHYPYPSPFDLSNPKVLAGVIGTCMLIAALVISLRWTRAAMTGWLFFFVAILPTMGIIGFTNVIASDKYAYLPAIGLLLAVSALLGWLWEGAWEDRRAAARRLGTLTVVLVLCGLEAVITRMTLAHWKDSVTLARHMLALTPEVALLHQYMGSALEDQGNRDEAAEEYSQALRLDPTFVEVHDALGRLLAGQGRFDDAIAHYRETLRLAPAFAEAHDNLALALAAKGNLDEAVKHHREALRLKPVFPGAWNNLAATLVKQGRLDEAVAHYREALRLSPAFAEAYNNLANALLKQGQVDQAVECYLEALRLKPTFAEAHNNLANALFRQGRLEEAIAHYTEALRLKPAFPQAHSSLAYALVRQNRLDEATQHYAEALRLNPESPDARSNLANVLVMEGRFDEAIRHYIEVLRLRPDVPEAHNNLANALAARGDLDEAVRRYTDAIRINPNFAAAHKGLGAVLERQGKMDEAVREYREALRLNPDDAVVRDRLEKASPSRAPSGPS